MIWIKFSFHSRLSCLSFSLDCATAVRLRHWPTYVSTLLLWLSSLFSNERHIIQFGAVSKQRCLRLQSLWLAFFSLLVTQARTLNENVKGLLANFSHYISHSYSLWTGRGIRLPCETLPLPSSRWQNPLLGPTPTTMQRLSSRRMQHVRLRPEPKVLLMLT